MLLEGVENYINSCINDFDSISLERRAELEELSHYIHKKAQASMDIELTFICTHNSRRSHLSQIWAQTAAAWYGIANISCWSGGTEATAFNPRAVKAVQDAGFIVEKKGREENPHYLVTYSQDFEPCICFSKTYDDPFNPQHDYCAIMTCSSADEACPIVHGAGERLAIRYEDPKAFDGTDLEEEKYAERCRQIAREMLYAFSRV
ncbi:MAG: protein-tyrosine-phosphatase [Calditrichota bacterium]